MDVGGLLCNVHNVYSIDKYFPFDLGYRLALMITAGLPINLPHRW